MSHLLDNRVEGEALFLVTIVTVLKWQVTNNLHVGNNEVKGTPAVLSFVCFSIQCGEVITYEM